MTTYFIEEFKMKLPIFILLLATFIQTSYAKLDEQQIALLEGNYSLINANENIGECPLKLATEYKWEESLDLAQIYLYDVTNEGRYFQDLSYVHKNNYSEFVRDFFVSFLKRKAYKTDIQDIGTGFVLTDTYQRQTRKNLISSWQSTYTQEVKLTLANDIQGDSLLVSVKKWNSEDVFDMNIECQYGKIK